MKKILLRAGEAPLKRFLGLGSSLLLVAGIMIGTGVFKKITPMAASGLGVWEISAAWVVAGLITILGALSVAGLTELTNESGGEYEYIRIIFGEFPAFVFGWSSFTVIGSASVAAMSHLFVNSLLQLYPVAFFSSPTAVNILACCIIILVTLLNCLGTRIGTSMNNSMTYLKILGLLIIIGGSFCFFRNTPTAENHTLFTKINPSGWMTVFFTAMLSAFWAYDGWLSIAFMTGEIKDPKRNLPKAIVGGISLVMVLYVFVNLAFMKVLPLSQLGSMQDNDIAAASVSHVVFGRYGSMGIALLVLVSTLGSLNGIIITYSRMYYKMAVDGFFFRQMASVHPRYETPYVSLMFAMVMSCLLVFSGNFDALTDMIVFAGFLFYALLAAGLIIMKRKRLVKAQGIGYPVVPLLFIICSAGLMVNTIMTMPRQTLMGLGLMSSGIPLYLWFKNKKKIK